MWIKNADKPQIEACHRMYSKNGKEKKTIVRLTNRRLIEELMSKRKEVNKYVENVGFPRGTEIYFNDNLCPYYRDLWFKARKLKKGNIVKYVWSSQGTVKVRRDSSSPIIKITHMEDLVSNFSDFDFYN